MRRALKSTVIAVSVAVTVALIATVFLRFSPDRRFVTPRFDLAQLWRALPRQLPWLGAFIALSAAMIPLRAAQWQSALQKRVPYSHRYHFVAIGALIHNALPGKLGDVFRA